MDNKIAVQRLFRGILLRSATSNEEKLFAQLFDNRSLSNDQLVILGWQSTEFLSKVAPIALLDYALSGVIDGTRIIGWYNSPSGAPLAPTGSDSTLNIIQVIQSGYGWSSLKDVASLASVVQQAALRLGFTPTSADASNLATQILAGEISLASVLRDAALSAIAQRPQLTNLIAAGLLESILSESVVVPSGNGTIPLDLASAITTKFLAPTISEANGMVAFETSANDGSLSALTLELTGVTWRGKIGDKILTLSGLPSGLSGKVVITGSQTAEIQFSGKARSHDAASSKDISITFSDTLFTGAKATDISPLVKGVLTVSLNFFDNTPWTITGNKIAPIGTQATSIDLESGTGTVGSTVLSATDLKGITSIDARNISGALVSLSGDANDNTFYANASGSTLRGRAGNDTLYAGKGADTFIFEAVTSSGTTNTPGNGQDTIYNFQIGAGGDHLDFRPFLGTPSFSGTAIPGVSLTAYAWTNGEVLSIYEAGNPLSTPSAIATLFGTALAAPSAPAKLVLITAGVPEPGDPGVATIWFVSNRSSAGNISTIESSEVIKVADLIGINNLSLLSLHADNIVI